MRFFLLSFVILSIYSSQTLASQTTTTKKPWTFLVYLNAFNNLDRFGFADMNEMETIGTTDKVNVVAQWASYKQADVRRVLVKKDNDTVKVTSPVIENLGKIDMGDYKNLIEFVKWGKDHYPADHYFVAVWNHGSGWHRFKLNGDSIKPTDISYDDYSNNQITTEQLGTAMNEIKNILGKKLDVYGSDACLMNMVEVVGEMKNAVDVVVGSQHLEPGAGWPYDTLLRDWNAKSNATAEDVANILTKNYADSYPNETEITLSALNLNQYDNLIQSIRSLRNEIIGANAVVKEKFKKAANAAQDFYDSDYRDLSGFVDQLNNSTSDTELKRSTLGDVKKALSSFVISNGVSSDMSEAHGVSIWLPVNGYTYDSYSSRYSNLVFNKDTDWLSSAKTIAK